MDLKTIRNFITIAENGSISKAAKELHISQPPLTNQMHSLEQELNTALFERTTKGVRLTPKGKLFYQKALSLISYSESIINEIREPLQDVINVGFVTSSTNYSIMLIHQYLSIEDVNFSITERSSFDLLDLLENRVIDMAIIREPFDMNKDFEYVKLIDDELIVAGLPSFFHNDNPVISFDDLYHLPIIANRRWVNHMDTFVHETRGKLHFKFICDDNRTAISCALNEMCVALLPMSAISAQFQKNAFTIKRIKHEFIKAGLYLVYDKKHLDSEASKHFIDFIQNQIPSNTKTI